MKTLNKIQQTALLSFALLGVASAAQAANLATAQAGAWTDVATWGGTAPAFTTDTGQGDNLTFNHAVTVGASDTVSSRAFTMNAGGSVSIASGGNVYLNKETIWKAASTWDTSSGYTFNHLPNTKYTFQSYNGDATWLHNGDLNLNSGGAVNDNLNVWARGNNNSSVTLAGSGLVTLQQLDIGISSFAITAFIDRDLTVEGIVDTGTTGDITLDLMSGTTKTDALFALSASDTVNFSGTGAVLRVLSTNLSVSNATLAIAAGYITKTVSGTGANSIEATTEGSYTRIQTSDAPPPETLTVINGSGGGSYSVGEIIPIVADAPATGFLFVNWTSNGGGSFADANAASTTFTMPAVSVTITANYALPSEVRLPGFFNDHMVLQRDMPVKIWGWANPGEAVSVYFNGQSLNTTADADGEWSVTLAAMSANAVGQTLVVNTIQVQDVLIGEVWICSGQSNMQFEMNKTTNSASEIAASDYPSIRLLTMPAVVDYLPRSDAGGTWQICGPSTVGTFSAVAYFFGRDLYQNVNVPIGLIDSSWGGTAIQPWIAHLGYQTVPELSDDWDMVSASLPTSPEGTASWNTYLTELGWWISPAEGAVAAEELPKNIPTMPTNLRSDQHSPTKIFNGMIHPLINFSFRGVIWYQGESNYGDWDFYYYRLKGLIEGWRGMWNIGDFPFYVVQLANLKAYSPDPEGGDGYARIRDAQRRCLEIPNTGLAVTYDIGETDNIHPTNKQDVGARLALWARAKDYGETNLVHSGPLYSSIEVIGSDAHLSFDHVGTGLMVGEKTGIDPTVEVSGGVLEGFAITGSDQVWYWADAVVGAGGDTVVVSSPDVPNPVAVRYAYRWNPINSNLYNKEGLPAVPFRTDDW